MDQSLFGDLVQVPPVKPDPMEVVVLPANPTEEQLDAIIDAIYSTDANLEYVDKDALARAIYRAALIYSPFVPMRD